MAVAQVHFDAGYVPARHSVAAFAQALRAVGEPVFGRVANAVAMSRVLSQLFEITALFEMHLRPELVLLQKTMVTVEGVARRIDPEHDIWAASEPVVRRAVASRPHPPFRGRGPDRTRRHRPAGRSAAAREPAAGDDRPAWLVRRRGADRRRGVPGRNLADLRPHAASSSREDRAVPRRDSRVFCSAQ
jgi:hypothetical protein